MLNDKDNFVSVECIICNKISNNIFLDVQVHRNIYTICKCNCGFIYLNPRITENKIQKHYNQGYLPFGQNKYNFIYKIFQLITFKWKKNIIDNLKITDKKILDVGSGNGSFIHYLVKNKYNADSYDEYYDYNKKNYKEYLKDKSTNYNVISFFHSLEHMYNINSILTLSKQALDENGYFIFALPNHNAIDRKIFNKNWIAYDIPRHLYHFNTNTLKKYLINNNIIIVKSYSMIQDTFFNVFLSLKKINIFLIIFYPIVLIYCLLLIMINKDHSSSLLFICKIK